MNNEVWGEEDIWTEVSSTISQMTPKVQRAFYVLFIRLGTIYLSLHDFEPSEVPIQHLFELEKGEPIYSRCRRLAPRHKQFVREELK